MAKTEIGTSKLVAVNSMLASVGLLRVSALDPSGSAEESRAEYILNHWTTLIQTEGYADNMRHASYTAGTAIEVGTDVLRLECIAPGRYAGNLGLIGNTLHCVTEDTDVIATDVHVHEWVLIPWADCAPTLKAKILSAATEDYAARIKQRGDLPQILEKQSMLADKSAQRNDLRTEGVPPNLQPTGIQARQPGGGSR